MNLLLSSLFFQFTFWKYSVNNFSFMGMLLDLGSYLQAHLWHSSLVFQHPWEEGMHSSPHWAKDNLSNREIRYFALSHNQPPCDRNFSSSPGTVSDMTREEDCGTGIEHGCNPGMGETQGVDQKEPVETSAVETRSDEGEELSSACSRPHAIFLGLCQISECAWRRLSGHQKVRGLPAPALAE